MEIPTLQNNIYPIQYIEPAVLKTGEVIQLRPVHRNDDKKVPNIAKNVSKENLYQRFLGIVSINEKLIQRFTQLDYDKEMAIVAEVKNSNNQKQLIGVARIAHIDNDTAEFAIIIVDKWHGKGLGKLLTQYIINVAKDLKYKKIEASLFSNNHAMSYILSLFGFIFSSPMQGLTKATKVLDPNFDILNDPSIFD